MTDNLPVPSYYQAPFIPQVHVEPAQPGLTGLSQDELTALRSQLITSILQVFNQALFGSTDPAATLSDAIAQITAWANGIPILSNIVAAITGLPGDLAFLTNFFTNVNTFLADIDFTSGSFNLSAAWSTFVTTVVQPLITEAVADFTDFVNKLFNVDIGSEDPLDALTRLGSNLQTFLASINFNLPNVDFDAIDQAGTWLASILVPAGGLSTATPIPPHLFSFLNTATSANNVLPDGSFDDPKGVVGLGEFTWSSNGRTKPGSMWTVANGTLRQCEGVAIPVVAGDAINVTCYVSWDTLTASAGNAITLAINAYSTDDAGNETLIPDSTHRVLATITAPGSAASSYTGHALGTDGKYWVSLPATGNYQAPTGTNVVRMSLEIGANVSVGNVGFDDCVMTVTTGLIDASLLKNLGNIGTLNPTTMAGISGIIDMVNTFGHLFDGLGSAFNPGGSLTGLSFSDLFALAQQGTTNTQTALFQAALHTLILGQRANKPASMGANPTSLSSFTAADFSSGGSLTTTSLTAGNCIAHRFTVPEASTYGFVEMLLGGTGLTTAFLNIFKVDPVTNAKTALFNSSNVASLIPSSINHVRILLPSMPMSLAGDELFIEFVNSAGGAITVATKATAVPNNTNEVIQNAAWTRTTAAGGASPTTLTSGQGTYSGTVPYAVIGITNVPPDYHPPEKTDYTTAGSHTYTSPSWLSAGDLLDVIGIGAGGGGGGSLYYVSGQGGEAAIWGAGSLVYDTDIKLGSVVTTVIGNRGAGGAAGNGSNGGNTTVQYFDPSSTSHTITFLGGDYGGLGGLPNGSNSNGANITGQGVLVNETYNNVTYFGGGQVNVNQQGQSPGGGGGGAPAYGNGVAGGVGEAHLVARQV